MPRRTSEWYEKRIIKDRMDEIFKAYALDEDGEEVVRIYMLFQHKDGRRQTKCLRYRLFFDETKSVKVKTDSVDAYGDLGLYCATDLEHKRFPEDIGIEWLWKDIDDPSPIEDACWYCICSTDCWHLQKYHWKCSNCGEEVEEKSNFCPHCGEKMDG